MADPFVPIRQLQAALFSGGPIKIRFGTVTVTWPGGTPNANTATITHGLDSGFPPVVVVGSSIGASFSGYPIVAFGTLTSTTFGAFIRNGDGTSPVAGSTATIAWIAIG